MHLHRYHRKLDFEKPRIIGYTIKTSRRSSKNEKAPEPTSKSLISLRRFELLHVPHQETILPLNQRLIIKQVPQGVNHNSLNTKIRGERGKGGNIQALKK